MTETKLQGKSERGVLATVTLSHFSQHFYAGLAILYPEIMLDLDLNYTQLGIMTGAASIVSGFLQIVWSILGRYLPRRILLGMGNIMMALGCFTLGIANSFVEAIGGSIVGGSGQAAQHPVGTSILTQKFSRDKMGWALSIHSALGYAGNIISPILLSTVSMAMGWRPAVYALAIVPLVTGLTVIFYLRGEEAATRSIQSREQTNLWEDMKSALHVRSALFIIAAEAFAVGGTGMGVITTYSPLFLKNVLKLGSAETTIIYTIAVAGGVVGTIIFGRLADRFGYLKVATTIVGTCSILILLLTLHSSFNLLLVPQLFLIGATSFATSSLLQAQLASITTPRQRDILIGFYFTAGFGISSVWTTLIGLVIDTYKSFNPAWMLRSALGAIAFTFMILASRQSPPTTKQQS